jgi:hypothetical protein
MEMFNSPHWMPVHFVDVVSCSCEHGGEWRINMWLYELFGIMKGKPFKACKQL